jgi:hypothetical protein
MTPGELYDARREAHVCDADMLLELEEEYDESECTER